MVYLMPVILGRLLQEAVLQGCAGMSCTPSTANMGTHA
jgi:hypothetical protein